jgi:PPOX class probable F420-dependent enzyme
MSPTAALTAEQDAFLRDHRWALVATVGRTSRPQVTMVAYHWDGHDLVMSIRSTAAKWRNLLERPDIAVTVADDLLFLTVSGRAEPIIDDPARAELTMRVRDSLLPAHRALLDGEIARGLDASKRVVVRLVPERAVGRVE